MAAREQVRSHRLEPYVPRVLSGWDVEAAGSQYRQIDGTLSFVDISGFTRLSESLAQRGRIGAEELTAVLDRVFGEMLRLAYDRGGSLLKFGGDALFLLFEGPDHAVQGASAAVEMRAALRQAVKVPTSIGRIELSMSVGVHTGPIDLFRVGTSHHELIITGATATHTTQLEAAANPGEIVISKDLRDRLPTGSAGDEKDPGLLLRWRAPRIAAPGPVIREALSAEVIESCVPTQLREFLSTAHAEPEHRIATVGFLKFGGISRQIELLGMEGVALALHRLVSTVQSAADAEGVTFLSTDIDEDGGKVILTTGAPSTQADDEGRMLRALRAIASSEQAFPIKIGANRGHVFAGEVGMAVRRTYTVMGDTVNLAARLMAAAPPGSVYAAPGVLDRSRTLFDATPLEPFHVKGKSEPVRAYSVGAETGVRAEGDHAILPFVGRGGELDSIRSAMDDLGSGLGSVVVATGDTGLGKTRLIEEALAGCAIERFVIRAEPNSSGNPYWSFRDPLRALLGIERRSQAEMVDDLESKIGADFADLLDELPLIGSVAHIDVADTDVTASIDPRFRQDRTADAMLRLLGQRFSSPTVIVAEDCHWMDAASLGLVRRVAGSAATGSKPWLVVATGRENDIALDAGQLDVRLEPLEADQARSVVISATEAAPLRPSELDAVVARAGGNPLFLAEIVRLVRETGSVGDLPDSLDAVVGVEIDGLPPLPRRLLRMASVLGRSFRRVVLEAFIAPEDIELDAATTRSLARFIGAQDPTRFSFRHATLHQVAYEGLPYRRRQELHARAGAVIETLAGDDPEAVAEFLALHYSQARDYEKAWTYAVIAGDRARERHLNVEAAEQYRAAVDAARHLDPIPTSEVVRIHEALGDVCEMAGLYDDADRAFQAARRLLVNDPEAVARLMAKQGLLREKAGRLPVALAWFRRGMKLLERAGAGGSAMPELMVAYGGIRFRQGKYERAIRWCESALEHPAVTDDQRGHALYLLVTLYAHLGMPEAAEAGRRAIEIFERTGDLVGTGNVLNNLGVDAYYRGNWEEALDLYGRSGDARRRAGDVIGAAASVNNAAEIFSDQGRLEEAIEGFREALYVWESSGFPVGVALANINLGRALTRSGEFEEAGASLERGLGLFREMGADSYVLESKLRIIELQLFSGHHRSAYELSEELLAEAGSDDATLMLRAALHRARAHVAHALGQQETVEPALERSLAAAESADSAFEVASTYEAMSRLLRDHPDASSWAERQREIFGGLGVVATPVIRDLTRR